VAEPVCFLRMFEREIINSDSILIGRQKLQINVVSPKSPIHGIPAYVTRSVAKSVHYVL
jgi:hypothetical protein